MNRIKLLKAWSSGDVDYEAGELLDISDAATAKALVDQGIAEAVEVKEPNVKKAGAKKEASEGGDDGEGQVGTITLTEKQFTDLVDRMTNVVLDRQSGDANDGHERPNVKVIRERWMDDPALGYSNPGEWLTDVYRAGTTHKGNEPSKKLFRAQAFQMDKAKKALGSDEYASVEDSIGGFFIQPQFDARFLTKGVESDWVRENGVMVIPTAANLLRLNAEVDEDRQTNLYGGVNVFWGGEREQLQDARGKFRQVEWKPDYLTGLYYITDHLLQSATAISAIIGRQFRDAFVRKETLAWLNGSGVGEPEGVLNSDALYSVTRDTTDSIKYADLVGMRARCWDYQNAVWVAAKGVYESLAQVNFEHIIKNVAGTENVGGSGQLVWQQQLVTDRPDILLGRPLFFTEFLQNDVGTKGDIMLISWPHYVIAESPNFVNDSSIHVRFDSLETAFRFAKRLDGRSWWRSTLTLQNGYEVSPFVALTTDT